MGGEEDQFLEGSVLGASFWRWWNRAWAGGAREPESAAALKNSKEEIKASTSPVIQEFVCIAATVPRPRPPRKSKPIDIPTKKPVQVPVFESVAEDKRYWYQ